ncbi:MAG: glycosyltransferase family 39 protein [Alphaproteobacteria bacterium]|nr:glycosyltransferase family 39 protein [Alphaproteobacteria bacterium]
MPDQNSQNKTVKSLFWITAVVLFVRLISLGFNPMFDSTESRYAEMGRLMYETGNWITPFYGYGVPFWGKPPLSFWATAASFHVFGVNDFAAHLPHFLFLLGTMALLYFFVKRYMDRTTAALSVAILATMTTFLYLMGGIMTDPALTFCVTLSIIGFFNAMSDDTRKKLWGYMFFAGLGLALLAKGPMVFPIVGAPVFFFVLFKNRWRDAFTRLPVIGGTLLMLGIALPWYLAAERATPGFLEYFIVGEHYLRFVMPKWSGDLYGNGHGGAPGQMVWFWLLSMMPWTLWIAIKMFWKRFRDAVFSREFIKNDFMFFILLNIAATILFFSLSTNVVMTYALTILAPSAAIIAWLINRTEKPSFNLAPFKIFAGLNVIAFAGLIIVGIAYPKWSLDFGRTDKILIETYAKERADENTPIYYFLRLRTWSSRYYSANAIGEFFALDELLTAAAGQPEFFVIMHRSAAPREYDFPGLKKTVLAAGRKHTLLKLETVKD